MPEYIYSQNRATKTTLIVAEIGINHNRDLDTAIRLCNEAKLAGADVIKTQLEAPTEHTLTYDETLAVYRHCEAIGMPFACTAFDVSTLEWLLKNTKMPFVKIASCDWNNIPLLRAINQVELPIIESRINPPHEDQRRNKDYKFLHVVPEYPTPLEHCNLSRVAEPWCSGLSDHSGNPLVPALAVAMGAKIVEVHLTLDRNQPGPDHRASLDPEGFRQMTEYVRQAESALSHPGDAGDAHGRTEPPDMG
jgi:N,N'-diacetyllegionaminate synthase